MFKLNKTDVESVTSEKGAYASEALDVRTGNITATQTLTEQRLL